MPKRPSVGLAALVGTFLVALPATATDDHLLLCEGAHQGVDFVEITNPTDSRRSLEHYYLSDHQEYYRLPAAFSSPPDPPGYASGDFVVRFPDDTWIDPGQSIVVVFDPAAFKAEYDPLEPDFEIRRPIDPDDDTEVPDMVLAYPNSVAHNAGFTGSGEFVVLFHWDADDPVSDLIGDVDIVRLGRPKETHNDVPNKSLQAVDGPDVGSATTQYPHQAMSMDMPPGDPAAGKSTKRLLLESSWENPGGSGTTGDDETSEKIAKTWDGSQFPYWTPDPGCCVAVEPGCYYRNVESADRAILRDGLNAALTGHKSYGWGDTLWEVLELADAHPDEPDDYVLDIYKNAKLDKSASPRLYHREHSWPKAYGFPETSRTPHTDCHALFLAFGNYNSTRNKRPFAYCDPGAAGNVCTELATDEYPEGVGGGKGSGYPGWSNWYSSEDPDERFTWETWIGRRGDVARAQFYMDVRYEEGPEDVPDLILTNQRDKIESSGMGAAKGYMGLLDDLIQWHLQDPVDDVERARHEIVFFYQKNRNPFIDHPEWVACAFAPGDLCPAPGDPADLAVVKTDGVLEVVPGEHLTYTIEVSNAGPAHAAGIVVEDALDPTKLDLDSVSWTCERPAGSSPHTGCQPGGGAGALASGVSVSLAPGASVRLIVEATSLPGASGTLVNTATVSPPAALVDPDGSDNASTDHTTFLIPGACGEFDDRDVSGQTVTTVETFTACRSIAAGEFVVSLPGAATFRAGETIVLRDGFRVDPGCEFTAEIDPSLAP